MKNDIMKSLKGSKSFFIFIFLMLVFRSALADWNDVPTGSMKPTIIEGDRILVNKIAYDIRVPFTHLSLMKLGDPARGDIVVFDSKASDKRLVKRVVGLPGDSVELKKNILYINGERLTYSYEAHSETSLDMQEDLLGIPHTIRVDKFGSALSSFPAITVPANQYLVLGDNRDNSADSRVIGFVPRNEIVGRSRNVVMSLDYNNYFLPRADRFLHTL